MPQRSASGYRLRVRVPHQAQVDQPARGSVLTCAPYRHRLAHNARPRLPQREEWTRCTALRCGPLSMLVMCQDFSSIVLPALRVRDGAAKEVVPIGPHEAQRILAATAPALAEARLLPPHGSPLSRQQPADRQPRRSSADDDTLGLLGTHRAAPQRSAGQTDDARWWRKCLRSRNGGQRPAAGTDEGVFQHPGP